MPLILAVMEMYNVSYFRDEGLVMDNGMKEVWLSNPSIYSSSQETWVRFPVTAGFIHFPIPATIKGRDE